MLSVELEIIETFLVACGLRHSLPWEAVAL